MNRLNISSGTDWEALVAYSRAVRLGNSVEVAGTTAVDDDGEVVGRDDPYVQSIFVLEKIERALQAAGATRYDVVRTRMYVTNIADWEQVGRAHGEFFRGVNPVTTLVQVSALIAPFLLVEIEATAIINS